MYWNQFERAAYDARVAAENIMPDNHTEGFGDR